MNSTWSALFQAYAGVAGFALYFLAPGFLLASGLNLYGFRLQSRAERLLWSVCLSLPISIEICVTVGRLLPSWFITTIFLVLAAIALVVLLLNRTRKAAGPHEWSRATQVAVCLTTVLGIYLVLAVTDIQIGQHLYVSTVVYDWSVRVPMVGAAIRSGVPPVNGLSAIAGQPAPLHYFYFWYVVCADVARMLHLSPEASLAASSVWAAWSLLAAFFLCLKYMARVRGNLRAQCALAFLPLGIMGLDLLPTAALFLAKKLHPYVEMEWWRWDRTPSMLSTAMYSPHHIAAFACIFTGLLTIALTIPTSSDEPAVGRAQLIFTAIFAGICFAAASGTSIFPTFIAVIVCLVWVVDLAMHRQFRTIGVLAGSACLAVLLSSPFLRELLTTPASASGSFVSLSWRNFPFISFYVAKRLHVGHGAGLLRMLVIQSGVAVLYLFELGFFLFVLIHQVRQDSKRKLSATERALWVFFCAACIPYVFLTSASIASPNDLGFDAGEFLRLLLQLWAVPWIYGMWRAWQTGTLGKHWSKLERMGFTAAAACLVIGLCGQVFQVLDERLYIALVGSGTIHKQMDLFTTDRLSERLYDIRQAYRQLDRSADAFPGTTSIQYNPISPMQPAFSYFATHQIAAFDRGCGTSYGGDYAACQAMMPQLLALYGNTGEGVDTLVAGNQRQDGAATKVATAADAEAMCRQLHLGALMAESLDTIWSRRDSWVWTMQPVVANDTVRVFRCPAG